MCDCDGCKADIMISRCRDGKMVPLHQSSKTGRLFVFETFPTFHINHVRLQEGT